jgi:heterodisulfide reductase subunit B
MTCCACCHSRLKQVNQQVKDDPELRAKISKIIEEDYQGSLNVLHITEVLAREVGLEAIKARVRKPLKGLKVACYYGCLMARMPESLLSDKSEYPMLLDNLMDAVGAEPVDWPYKTECCGAALTLTQTKTVIRLSANVLQMAKQSGADALVVACPLCQANLDMFQGEAEKLLGERFSIPVLYFVQLMGLAMNLDLKRICLDRLIVDPLPILAEKGFIDGGVYL